MSDSGWEPILTEIKKTYKKRCFVVIAKPFYDNRDNKCLYSYHQNYSCKKYIHMVPQEMDIN